MIGSIITDGEESIEEICDRTGLHEVCLSIVFLSNATCSSARRILEPFPSGMLEQSIASLQEEVEEGEKEGRERRGANGEVQWLCTQ